MVIWTKFGNSSIFVKEVIITSVLWGFDQKHRFFGVWSWFKFNNLRLTLGTSLKFYSNVSKGLKLKTRKFWRLIPTFAEVTEEKLVGRGNFLPPITNRVKRTSPCTFYWKVSKQSKGAVWRCSSKRVFSKISQNLQENMCASVYFEIKLQASGELNQVTKNTFFQRTRLVAVSEN